MGHRPVARVAGGSSVKCKHDSKSSVDRVHLNRLEAADELSELQKPGDTVALNGVDVGSRSLGCGCDSAEVPDETLRRVRSGDVGPRHAEHARARVENRSSLDLIAAYLGVFVEPDPATLGGQRDSLDVSDSLRLGFAVIFTHCGEDKSGLP
jgi:hypothetical protein